MTVAEAKATGTIFDDNTILIDDYENEVVVPKGFKIASGVNGSATAVTDGIVIEDATYENRVGSQFVWIPVGTIYTDAEKTTNTITLGRYEFGTDGTPNIYSGDYSEDTSTSHDSNYINQISKDIQTFLNKSNDNGGYYIGRYEARIENYSDLDISQLATYTPPNPYWTGYVRRKPSGEKRFTSV